MRNALKLITLFAAGLLSCRAPAPHETKAPSSEPEATDPAKVAPEGDAAPQPCDPATAWEAFETLLRDAYAYVERSDFDVDKILAAGREATLSATNAEDVRRALLLATYAFTDPHLLVKPLRDSDPNVIPTTSDLVIKRRNDRFFVTQVRADSAAAGAGVRPGWELTAVDGDPVEEAAGELLLGAPESRTPRQWSYAATLAANGLRGEARSLGFRVAGEARELPLANPREFAEEVSERAPLTVLREEGVLILRFENSLGTMDTVEAVDQALATVSADETVLLDLRNTPSGGNTDVARGIIGHFISETRPYQMHRIPAVERRHGVPREFVEHVVPREPLHAGKVIVLGGPWTGSMGEGIVIGMDAAAEAHTIASDMGDLLGAVFNEPLGHCDATVNLGVESLFHVDGTPRADYVADTPLEIADLDAAGVDPAMVVARKIAVKGR